MKEKQEEFVIKDLFTKVSIQQQLRSASTEGELLEEVGKHMNFMDCVRAERDMSKL